ncbi:hypothetical protein MSG94_06540 [Acinetobacter baumannii]|nr:hypothetical protein [Acinetobacter baumannii]MDV4278009.1 hypothetical protein [Acinetobacter baumannii]
MSEFKVGDKVVFQNSKSDDTEIYTVEAVLDGGRFLGINDYRQAFSSIKFRHAEPQEIAAGHRIDMPTLPKPIGSLQELHPEFAKVLHENFLELLGDESNTVQVAKDAIEHGNDLAMVSIEGVEHVSIAQVINPFPCEELGDDSHIENHISPLCKSKDV